MYNFGHQRLVDLINLDKMGRVTLANCKQVMQLIVDGDTRMPSEIAETQGFTGGAQASKELKEIVTKIVEENKEIVQKVIATGKTGPIMSLVGTVMQVTNRKSDPVVIKHLIIDMVEEIKKKQK